MNSVNTVEVREEANDIMGLEQVPCDEDREDGWHIHTCTNMMEFLSVLCIRQQVEAARQ